MNVKEEQEMNKKTVIAFGGGRYFLDHASKINEKYDVSLIVDNDTKLHGEYREKIQIASVDKVKDFREASVLITNIHIIECVMQLLSYGIKPDQMMIETWGWPSTVKAIIPTFDGIEINWNDLRISISNECDMIIFKDIFLQEDYNLNMKDNCILIDIGMNTGQASLFFASKENYIKIYGFEPDEINFEKAQYNFKQNIKFSNKIESFNYALSDCDKTEQYIVNPIKSAGVRKKRDGDIKELNVVDVVCKDCSKIIESIIDEHEGKERIIVKCDCEGAEYEIFARLEATHLIDKIDAFVMEWHCDRRNEIEDFFSRNNFIFYINTTTGRTFGKCYAVNIKKSIAY